jgi:hypothetical protein
MQLDDKKNIPNSPDSQADTTVPNTPNANQEMDIKIYPKSSHSKSQKNENLKPKVSFQTE